MILKFLHDTKYIDTVTTEQRKGEVDRKKQEEKEPRFNVRQQDSRTVHPKAKGILNQWDQTELLMKIGMLKHLN